MLGDITSGYFSLVIYKMGTVTPPFTYEWWSNKIMALHVYYEHKIPCNITWFYLLLSLLILGLGQRREWEYNLWECCSKEAYGEEAGHYKLLSQYTNKKASENWMAEWYMWDPQAYSRKGIKWDQNYKHKALKIILGFALIPFNWLMTQISLIQKVTSLRILFPIFLIMQHTSMVYKLLKYQIKLNKVLPGRGKKLKKQFFVLNTL